MNILVVNSSPVRNGATAEIVKQIVKCTPDNFQVKAICIDDFKINYCKGCKVCYKTAKCVQDDDVVALINEFTYADKIIIVAPSNWADIPGQFKSFIDRCTPYCNTHEPHASIGQGKKGYSIALRTGSNEKECNRIIESIEHFYGHMEIKASGSLSLCEVMTKEEVIEKLPEIRNFCNKVIFAK